jgi:hypothetical protein
MRTIEYQLLGVKTAVTVVQLHIRNLKTLISAFTIKSPTTSVEAIASRWNDVRN